MNESAAVIVSVLLLAFVAGFFLSTRRSKQGLSVRRVARDLDGKISEEAEKQILAFIHHGQKIEAIKFVRSSLGIDLKDAKEVVEAIAAGTHIHELDTNSKNNNESQFAIETADSAQLQALVRSGKKIEAVKLLVKQQGLGLKEAKDLIDSMSK